MVSRRNRICIALTMLFALVGVSGAGEMPETTPVDPQNGETPVLAPPAPADEGIAAGEDNSVLQPAATDNASAFPGQPPPTGSGDTEGTGESGFLTAAGEQEEAPTPAIADPIEPVNRGIFYVNDKLYRWVLKPVAKGYKYVVPEGVRISVRNFFINLATPIRAVNTLLQGKIKDTGTELARFGINSTIGMAGLFDAAKEFHLTRKDEDTGQTLGVYGLGNGFYLVLPILGPSSARDAVGLAGDTFLDPTTYLLSWEAALGLGFVRTQTDLTFRIDEYEELTDAAVDPYAAVKDVYIQYRAKKVRE
jgi:phospholipid-binding lipoprotein MlaA